MMIRIQHTFTKYPNWDPDQEVSDSAISDSDSDYFEESDMLCVHQELNAASSPENINDNISSPSFPELKKCFDAQLVEEAELLQAVRPTEQIQQSRNRPTEIQDVSLHCFFIR